MPPSRQIAIVACMDARLNVYKLLGINDGEAHVIRNAGGVITDDEIRSLAISQRLLGTRETVLIHHADCEMSTFSDIAVDVKQSLRRVKGNPFLPHRDQVRGFIFDVATRLPHEVHE